MSDFLLEVRTEEIPANALPSARRQLREALNRALVEEGFEGADVHTFSTNRRLVALVSGLPGRQPDRTEVLTGPPARVAFDADGAPTKAAEGFARKAGVPVEQLERVETPKGEYLSATIRLEGRPTAEILAGRIPGIIGALHFPKMMRWGLGTHVFVRPVHGVVAMFDGDVVPMELLDIRSGSRTVGHRVHAPEAFELTHPSAYASELEERRVFIDPAQRRRRLEKLAAELASQVRCHVHPDEALVAEHVELVEFPGLIRGQIDPAHLELPREVVITTLRHHQKCLILEREDGELAPYFLAVVDRADDPEGLIRQGNEWVIGARLSDAAFFFKEDRTHRLEDLVPQLERLEFHRKLGSLAAKAERAGLLARWLVEAAGMTITAGEVERVARLVKADLVTHMVGEFPELQGIMGGHYLRLDGEPEEVWTAARDHYLPQGFEGEIPASDLGRLVGAADRMDSVASLFAVGEVPTGSKDPFGLRRAAQGLVRIVAGAGWTVDLAAFVRRACELAVETAGGDLDVVSSQVMTFVTDRVRRYLVDLAGMAPDTADAVMHAAWSSLPALEARARALEAVRGEPEFRALALAFKRVRNITEGQPDAGVDPALFAEPAERELYEAALAFQGELEMSLAAHRVDEAFAGMGKLAGILDQFFIDVLVMAEDERVRANRIGLLKMLGRDFLTLADLSRLQVEGGES
ncbi:MAG: glycine--tRNA ligase subunit beta [Acidobacteria bacterium]|nr:glycine--tRNA ligase subunit beta [Acidobacteriota bacterium]